MAMKRTPFGRSLLGATLAGVIGCAGPTVSTNSNSGSSAGDTGSSSGSGGASGVGEISLPTPSANGSGGSSAAASGGTSGSEPSAANNCGVKKIALMKQPADLLLVLDRSRSMLQDVNGGGGGGRANGGADAGATAPADSKWTDVVGALDPVIMSTQGQVAWGLKMFPLGGDTCSVPDGATVPVATSNYSQVMAAVKANDPALGMAGSTPTRLAVTGAAAFMKASASTNTKYLVLATDGLPNCGDGGRGNGGNDAAGAIAAVADAAAQGIETFVVGIATANSDANDTLNQMAVKGGQPRNDTTKYYPVASRDELVSALESITGQIASCTFPLDQVPPVPENVAVEVDGTRLSRDTAQKSGWNYGPNDKSIVLFGAQCDALKAGSAKDVQILFGCPGVQID